MTKKQPGRVNNMMFMRNMAIKYKLMAIIMVTCIVVVSMVGTIQILYERDRHYQRAVNSMSCYADIIGDNCIAALTFKDSIGAELTLRSLRAEPSIAVACIYDKDKKVLAEYYGPKAFNGLTIPVCKEEQWEFKQNYLLLYKKIHEEDDDEVVGTVFLQLDLGEVHAAFWGGIRSAIMVSAAAIGLAYLMSLRLQRIISSPILNLANVARVVSEEKDYTKRAVKTSNDEFGFFVDAFNEMFEQIQERDLALVDAKEHLEANVAERTAELSHANAQLKDEIVQRTIAEESLKEMNEKLAQSNRQLQEFTYIASHDLREPTRKITAFGQLLEESIGEKLDEDDRENLNFMVDGATRMQQMIEALLEYSRVTTKGVDFEPVNLNVIVDQLRSVELAMMIEETHGILSVQEHLPAVKGDQAQIRQLLQNLVSNAMKYQKKGVIPEVQLRAKVINNGMVRIEVQDNGIGIKREQCENVFVMFRRLHSRQEYEGTGIGLAVCKKIVERHAGQIGVESVYGEGSTFWFTLPVLEEKSESFCNLVEPIHNASIGV